MKKRHTIILLAAALVFAMAFMAVVYGVDTEPGSEGNPLITKLYLDDVIDTLKESLGKLEARVGNLEKGGSSQAAATWEVIQVNGGKSVMGGEGTEIVLRSGSAVAVDNGANGVSDLTAGVDLKGGTAITSNHLLLVPRQDGRGIKCVTSCWVMVLGDYTIE